MDVSDRACVERDWRLRCRVGCCLVVRPKTNLRVCCDVTSTLNTTLNTHITHHMCVFGDVLRDVLGGGQVKGAGQLALWKLDQTLTVVS